MGTGRIYKVSCDKAWGKHVGLFIEGEGVFHNAPGKGEHLSNIQAFSEGKPITYELVESVDYFTVVNKINTALQRPKQYDLLKYNCEDSLYAVLEGEPRSPQRKAVGDFVEGLAKAVAVVMIIVGVVGLAGVAVKGAVRALRA